MSFQRTAPVYGTTAEVKAALAIDSSDTAHDQLIADIGAAVADKIDEHCGRWFYTLTQTRYYAADVDQKHINPFSERRFGSILKLDIDDFVAVTKVQVDLNGDRQYELTLDPTKDYYLEPVNAQSEAPPRPYTTLVVDLVNGQGWYFPPWPKSVAVTGSVGFCTNFPDEVHAAWILQTIRIFKRPASPLGVLGGGDFAYPIKVPVGLDPDVQLMLQDLKTRHRKLMFA